MSKIIIDVRDDIIPVVALECVKRVVARGKVSEAMIMMQTGTPITWQIHAQNF